MFSIHTGIHCSVREEIAIVGDVLSKLKMLLNFFNGKFLNTSRGLHLYDFADSFAKQCIPHGGCVRYGAMSRIGLHAPDDGVV